MTNKQKDLTIANLTAAFDEMRKSAKAFRDERDEAIRQAGEARRELSKTKAERRHEAAPNETPETDAAVKASNGQWSFTLKETCQRLERERDEARKIASDLAEQAERLRKERNEAREDLRITQEAWAKAKAERIEALRERDEAREKYTTLLTENMFSVHQLCKERDEARKELNEIRAERDLARLSSMESDQAHDRMVGELESVYKQLDDARKRAAKLAGQLLAEMESTK